MASGGFQNFFGGGSSDAFLVKFSSCITTQIDENAFEHNVFVYPNPAGNKLAISIPMHRKQWAIESVEVYDVLGARCLRALTPNPSPLREGSASINVSELKPGIYFVKVKTKEGERVAKFVKQ
jgi:hypothetical protein